MHDVSPALVLFTLATVMPAQTFVVDPANGPGTHFTNLQTALTAVPDGATLIVRAGSYGPIELNGKGVTIVGGSGVMLSGLDRPAIHVTNLAPHQSFSLRGAFMGWANPGAQVHFAGNAGRVLLQEFTYAHTTSPWLASFGSPPPSGILVENCAQVALRNCSVFASNAIDAIGSHLDLESCTLRGTGSTTVSYHNPVHAGTPALRLQSCTARVAVCSLTGGPGPLLSRLPSAAIATNASVLSLGGQTTVVAGTPIGITVAVPAITGSGSLRRDPLVFLAPNGGAPAILGSLVDTVQPWPTVISTGGQLGLPATAQVRGANGELVILCVSFPGTPSVIPEVNGRVWLDTNFLEVVALGTQSNSAPIAFTAVMPVSPALAGRPRAWQAVSWSSQLGLQASNASLFVLRP